MNADQSTVEDWTPDDWKHLGARVRTERESQGFSRRKMSEVSGVSEKSIQLAEEGRVPKGRWPQSLNALERALGWERGSTKAVLDGGEPCTRAEVASDSPAETPAVTIPAALYADLIAVAAHVSAGRSAAFVQQRPYPDALARRTLGALDDAGLLPTPAPSDPGSGE